MNQAERDVGVTTYSEKRLYPPYIYVYFTLVKIVQPFSQPFIIVEFQKETG